MNGCLFCATLSIPNSTNQQREQGVCRWILVVQGKWRYRKYQIPKRSLFSSSSSVEYRNNRHLNTSSDRQPPEEMHIYKAAVQRSIVGTVLVKTEETMPLHAKQHHHPN